MDSVCYQVLILQRPQKVIWFLLQRLRFEDKNSLEMHCNFTSLMIFNHKVSVTNELQIQSRPSNLVLSGPLKMSKAHNVGIYKVFLRLPAPEKSHLHSFRLTT